METRANFVLIGAFTLAAIAGAFLFVMWIATSGTGSHRHFQIIFDGSVTGLSTGSSVLFNGLKVGEVTQLRFVQDNPGQVIADIDVTTASAPINSSTRAQLETQGLTGSGVVALKGGDIKGANDLAGNPPIIPSLPTASLADIQTKAGYVLDLANKVLVDNAEPIHRTLENVQNFSQALARNTDGVDAALQGMSDLGKAVQPLAAKLQSLADHSDTLVSAINPEDVKAIVRNIGDATNRANAAIGELNKLIAENSGAIHSTLGNVDAFTNMLAENRDNVQTALRGAAELGKNVQPLVERLQSLSDSADQVVKAINPDDVKAIVHSVGDATNRANAAIGELNKLIAENSGAIHSTLGNVDAFTNMLAENRDNVQTALQGAAELGKNVQPLVARLQSLSDSADQVVKAIDPEKVRSVLTDAQTFAKALSSSSGNYTALMRDGSTFIAKLNETSKTLDSAIGDLDTIVKAVEPRKVANIVDSINGVATTLKDNRPNIDETIRNANAISATLNKAAGKVDGVLDSAQSFLGSPGTQGAVQRIGEAAQSVKLLADNVNAHVKDIAAGLSRFSNSGLRQYEALAVQGQRVLDDIDRVVRSFSANPGQLIWGSRPGLPEYRGQQ